MTTKGKNKKEDIYSGDLNSYVYMLLQDEPFWAVLSRYITKRANTNIPTARVFVDAGGYFIMEYNPNFFARIADREKIVGVILHEFQHIALGHITTRFARLDESDHRFWNIATDLAINSLIGPARLPPGVIFPGVGEFKDLPKELSAEHYLSLVRKKHSDAKDGQSDHSAWGLGAPDAGNSGDKSSDSSEPSRDAGDARYEIAEKRVKDILSKAISECSTSRGWGTVSESLRREILARVKTVVDWRKVLRFFVHATQRSEKTNSIRRINKRFPYIHPGRKVVRHARLAISVDMSGSVGDELLGTFFAELDKLSHIAEFTVIPFDHSVAESKVFVWKKGQRVKPERVLCGGTNFEAPTRYVNEHNFDGHIICTDMEAPVPGPSRCRRMWATTKSNMESSWSCNPKRERVIFVEPPKSY